MQRTTIIASILLPVFALLLPWTATAQHFPPAKELASLVQKRIDDKGAVGIVLGVMEADGSTLVVSAGEAGQGAKTLGERSIFEIGSISKVFTATFLADMVQRGRVNLSDPVSSSLPDSVRVPSRAGRDVTLIDLATHHSGLPRLPSNMAPADRSNPYADYSVQQLYEFLSEHELTRDIGSQYEYSNLAVGLLGHALSRAAGTSYEEAIRRLILEPLGIDMSGIELDSEMSEWMAKGHDLQGNVVPLWDLPTLAGAGALRSTVHDMLRFLAANTGEPKTELERAMRTTHLPREQISGQMSIGLNWHIRSVGNSTIVWHNGGTAGFRTFIGFDPAREVGVVVLTNSAHGADDIGLHLINKDIPLTPPKTPIKRTEIVIEATVLKNYVGQYELSPQFSIVVTLEAGALFIQATGQSKFPVFAESSSKFFLKVVDAQISFQRDEVGAVTGLILHQNGQNQPGKKVRKDIPLALPKAPVKRTEIVVATKVLEDYVGEYALSPQFSITVTLEDGALFIQATNQGKAPVYAESETKFFYKVVDAQISFQRDEAGAVTGLILHQGGRDMPGQKVQ